MDRHRRVVVGLALLLAAMEVVDAFFIEQPAFAVGFAVVLALLSWWAAKTGAVSPVVVIGLLALVELASVLFIYPNSEDSPAVWNTALFAVVTAATAVAAFVVARHGWRARRDSPAPG